MQMEWSIVYNLSKLFLKIWVCSVCSDLSVPVFRIVTTAQQSTLVNASNQKFWKSSRDIIFCNAALQSPESPIYLGIIIKSVYYYVFYVSQFTWQHFGGINYLLFYIKSKKIQVYCGTLRRKLLCFYRLYYKFAMGCVPPEILNTKQGIIISSQKSNDTNYWPYFQGTQCILEMF